MKRISGFSLAILCLSVVLLGQGDAAQTPKLRPNVIVVITDDQGYGDFSCHGNPVLKTPHLDELAAQSIRLTNFHAMPMCTPTRGQLLTGLDAAAARARLDEAGGVVRRALEQP